MERGFLHLSNGDRVDDQEVNFLVLVTVGGDEFALLLSDENPQQVCEQLEQQVKPLTAEHGISFSIGVANFTANAYDNPDALLAAADQAMYTAKQAFRAQHRKAPRSERT